MVAMRAFILLVALVGCGRPRAEIHFPSDIAGGWRLEGAPVESLAEAWPDARTHGLESLAVAKYSGDGDPVILAHRMASSAGAFETMQRFRAEAGATAFQYGIFFIVVRSPAMGQAGLSRFTGEFKQRISR